MMTEEEAKTKWCPHARYVIDDSGAGPSPGYPTGNRFGGHEPSEGRCLCIASSCMAWRWSALSHSDGTHAHAPRPEMEFDGKYRGQCGLAGKP